VRAQDRYTGQLVDGEVLVDDNPADQPGPHAIGKTNTPVPYTFKSTTLRHFDQRLRAWIERTVYPTGTVTATGYAEMTIDWGFPSG
jgi:hypothetical protein